MLNLARQFDPVLRAAGIDPENVEKIEVVATGDKPQVRVTHRPETVTLPFKIEMADAS